MSAQRILFVNQEITPYLETSYMSIIGRYLPQSIQEKGLEIRTFMPRYGLINERRNQLHGVIRLSGQNIMIDDNDHTLILKVASIQSVRMQTYFIDNEEYFSQRALLHDKMGKFLSDNDERAIFYARGVIETVKNLGWSPDIIHCQGWLSCLAPLFIKKLYIDNPLFANSKIVYSVYNDTFDKAFRSLASKLKSSGIPSKDAALYKQATFESTIKLAINYSDAIVISHKDVSDKIRSHISRSKKPFFEHKEEQYGEDYLALYNSII
ncbi:MAG: glycogen/starch synthase [Bacteroidales bacterium]|jgi:starch synthase|nr:glycogen/starch synthase [Bacteroidales bacterium]